MAFILLRAWFLESDWSEGDDRVKLLGYILNRVEKLFYNYNP